MKEKILNEINEKFNEYGYQIVNSVFNPEQTIEQTDEFTGDTYAETTNNEFIAILNKSIPRGDKKFRKVVDKLADVIYMKYGGTILKIASLD
jgi:hypothetical protein